MRTFTRTAIAALVAGVIASVVVMTLDAPESASADTTAQPDRPCFEDEAIVWTGTDHDACVAIDDLVSEAIEPCIVASYSEDRPRAPIYGDVDAAVMVRSAGDTGWVCESAQNLPPYAR